MKKDLQSYKKHNEEYLETWNSYQDNVQIIKKYDQLNIFKNLGFEYGVRMSNPLPETHVDIGSGNGWLVRKTAPLFKTVIGIEPSEAIIKVAGRINKGNLNVSFINEDMVDGLSKLHITDPIFITTATVLNHIEDYYVKEFLSLVNSLPIGSTLFFDERYDKNINWNMWHVRNKDWWRENLPNWQLLFCDIEVDGYSSGIFGKCLGKNNILPNHKMNSVETLLWKVSGVYFISMRVVRKILKIILE